jgi:hypothetical protein
MLVRHTIIIFTIMSDASPFIDDQKAQLDTASVNKAPYDYPFWFGGSASCCAVCLTHPLDLGKALQLAILSCVSTNYEH